MYMVQTGKPDPESLVTRIVAELEANPAAQPLLLRALLTNEFRGMPLRLDHIEADIREMKVDIRRLKADVSKLKTDVAELKGDFLEFKLPQRIRAFLSQKLELRGTRIMQSTLGLELGNELSEAVEQAADSGVITGAEETRVLETDLILRARRKLDKATVWVAVEASHTVDGYDVDRARESADILRRLFSTDSVAVAMGYGDRAGDRSRAEETGVEVFVVDRRRAA